MGTELTDPYFTRMLELVRDDLHSFNYARHYLVLRIDSIDEKPDALAYAHRFKKDFGIETVFFEENASNSGLANFVTELEEAVLPRNVDILLPGKSSKMIAKMMTQRLQKNFIK